MSKTMKTSENTSVNDRADSKQNQPKRVRRTVAERQDDMDALELKMKEEFQAKLAKLSAKRVSLDYVQDIKDLKTAVIEGQYADAREIIEHLTEVLPKANTIFDGPSHEDMVPSATV